MRRWLAAGVLAVALVVQPAFADYTSYYTYYKVKRGDTIHSVAAAHGVSVRAIQAMNPGLEGDTLESVTFLCVPNRVQEVAEETPRPEPKKSEPKTAKAKAEPAGDELSQEEIAYLEEEAVGSLRSGGGRIAMEGRPAHQNVFVGSDGRVVHVPQARPKVEEVPKGRRSLSSRKGKFIHALLKSARNHLGVPYVWGGESATGVDCSGFVQRVFLMHGISLPRTADIQFNVGSRVTRGKELPGDLVFFETYAPGASHVGIYLGNRYFIHASSVQGQVAVSSLDEPYFQARYLGAKRNF